MSSTRDTRPRCRREPERTLLYHTVQAHHAAWLALQDDGTGGGAPAAVEREFHRYLECGILAHGFARARCADGGHDFRIAYSCTGREVCPSCTTRRMVATAAHLADHAIAHLPVRQWVLAVPKRLRYHLERDPAVLHAALPIVLHAIEQQLRQCSPGAGGEMRIIGFITAAVAIREILGHLGEPTSPPGLAHARGPPLWAMLPDAARGALDPQAQPVPEYEFEQRIAW